MTTHWTAVSVDDFVHRLSFDFITQLAKRLKASPINRAECAAKLGISKGRVSQIFNNTSNLTLRKAVEYAQALGMKASVIAYDDHDPNNKNGPVNSEIFQICWNKAGRPTDFESAENITDISKTVTTAESILALPDRKGFVLTKKFARTAGNMRRTVSNHGTDLPDLMASTSDIKLLAIGG